MEECSVYAGEEEVGRITFTEEGLYYRYQAICKVIDAAVKRLVMVCDGIAFPLGIFVPEKSVLKSSGKIPKREMNGDDIKFLMQPKYAGGKNRFPVHVSEPFANLEGLENGVLETEGEQCFIII